MDITRATEKLLLQIMEHCNEQGICDVDYWENRFETLSSVEDELLRDQFKELKDAGLVNTAWASDVPYQISIKNKGYEYFKTKEQQNPSIGNKIDRLLADGYLILKEQATRTNPKYTKWIGNVKRLEEILPERTPLKKELSDMLFFSRTRKNTYESLIGLLQSLQEWVEEDDKDRFVEDSETGFTYNGKGEVASRMYDVFISHANKDKIEFVDTLNESLEKLGIEIFYDKKALEWGDNWKGSILEGTKKAEFAIIVISENFFGREWTERELAEFLNRQNQDGQKLILPILHNITIHQLQEKYPSIADIQAIDSREYNCDQIALLFARQLIKRLKSV